MSDMTTAIENHFKVPAHVLACAAAIRFDLMNGPSWSVIPPIIEAFTVDHFASDYESLEGMEGDIVETYTSTVAQTLRDYINDLPSELWVDNDCDCVMTNEPDSGYWYNEETGDIADQDAPDTEESGWEWCDNDLSNTYHFERNAIVKALFGETIAKEFR